VYLCGKPEAMHLDAINEAAGGTGNKLGHVVAMIYGTMTGSLHVV